MIELSQEIFKQKQGIITAMEQERLPWWQYWRELSEYLLPARYVWLQSDRERRLSRRNSFILDPTGTKAAKTLASGMMNGITSPARPWFKLRVNGFEIEDYPAIAIWTDEVERRMLRVMAESNFYNSMAVLYLDLVVFGVASALIYESPGKVIHCFNPALGEFYLAQNSEHRVHALGREFRFTVHQLVKEFGLENCSQRVKDAYKHGGARLLDQIDIIHLIEPNDDGSSRVGKQFSYREYFWEKGVATGQVLRERGYFDFPGITPRWDLTANDVYGTGPGMDALPDVIQLQHETKKKAQGIDKLVSPPILADVMLEHKPTALLPNGITYVPRLDATNGARPIYTVNPPLGEMSADIRDVQTRIRETFHNELFQMISQLDTVRSAAEIDARREEKLVLLGPVLERFENEALDPAIQRIFGIMDRNGLLPAPPPEIEGAEIEIQYVSILSTAQAAVGTASTERFLALIGNMVEVFPEVREVPNIPELVRDYGRDIGVRAKNMRSIEEVQASIAAQNEKTNAQEGLDQTTQIAAGGKLLSETDVGGGQNVLQRLLGGAV